MAVIKPRKALAALTSAALGLPRMAAQAATPATQAEGNTQFGHYEESGNRMKVDVYHGDFVLPINDRAEFTFSIDRDTYSGASPAYSIPVTMTNQIQYTQQGTKLNDVVTSASGGVTASGLTVLGGLNTYKGFLDARASAEAEYRANNPEPPSPPPQPGGTGPVTIDFQTLSASAYYGTPNTQPLANGGCAVVVSPACYEQNGALVGTISIGNSSGLPHIHKYTETGNIAVQYHADSGGIYLREKISTAFALKSMEFNAATNPTNPNTGAAAFWEILGFNTALNPNLSSGNGTQVAYPTAIAAQQVLNGFNGTLALNDKFQNINAFLDSLQWLSFSSSRRRIIQHDTG